MTLISQTYCLYCERTSQQVPLIQVTFQDRAYWICPEHLPIMIHKPHLLAEILPGIETDRGEEQSQDH